MAEKAEIFIVIIFICAKAQSVPIRDANEWQKRCGSKEFVVERRDGGSVVGRKTVLKSKSSTLSPQASEWIEGEMKEDSERMSMSTTRRFEGE